jgi:hypothetical protein
MTAKAWGKNRSVIYDSETMQRPTAQTRTNATVEPSAQLPVATTDAEASVDDENERLALRHG